jgi:Uma2 family endonuclease
LRKTPTAEQIMAMPAVQHRWTAREVRALIAEQPLATPRLELVDGELLVTPSPNSRHQMAVTLLLVALHEYLSVERVGYVLTWPFDVEVEPESLTQPDVFVIPNDEWERLDGGVPTYSLTLAVEVLSPSSGRHDRVRKRPLYQRNVPEYWIVDTDARLIERWRTDEDRAESVDASLEWMPNGATAPFVLDVAAYFSRVFGERD